MNNPSEHPRPGLTIKLFYTCLITGLASSYYGIWTGDQWAIKEPDRFEMYQPVPKDLVVTGWEY